MNRNRLLVIGLLALVLGGIASLMVYRSLQSRHVEARQPGVDVVVANSDITVGAQIEDKHLRVENFPANQVPPGAFSKKSQVIGRGAVVPITKNEFLLPGKLSAQNGGSGLPGLIPTGMRAVSVGVNEVVQVAGFVQPGTRVDVLLTGNPGGKGQQTTTVLENVQVIAAGTRLDRNAGGDPQRTPVITLLVTPEDAQKLTLASAEGRIQLALRSPLDNKQEELAAVHATSLYRAGQAVPVALKTRPVKKTAAPPPPETFTVELIRGNKKEEEKF